MQRVIIMFCFVFLTTSQNEAKITCSIPRVDPDQDTVVTCNFPEDLSVTKKDFTVYHYVSSNTPGESPEAVLDCWWLNGILDCFEKNGFTFNKTVSTRLGVVFKRVDPTRTGVYGCQAGGYGPGSLETCELQLKLGKYNKCNISVEASQPQATLMCYFNEDIRRTQINFAVYKHSGQDDPLKVLDCWWENQEPKCSTKSVKQNLQVFSSSLTLTVPKETGNIKYSCGHANDRFEDREMCTVQEDDSEEEQDISVTGIVIGVIIAMVVAAAVTVVIVKFRRQLLEFWRTTRNKDAKDEDEEAPLVTKDMIELKDREGIATSSLAYMIRFVKGMYPNIAEGFCITPSVYFNDVRYKEDHVGDQLVYIPESSNSVSETHDRVMQRILHCFRHLAQHRREEMFVFTQFRYENGMVRSEHTQTKPADSEIREQIKCFDLMIVHRHGITVVVVKDVDDNQEEEENVDKNVLSHLSEAVEELRNAGRIMSHVMSDQDGVHQIHKALMLPNISSSTLRRALQRETSLVVKLHECLNIEASTLSIEATNKKTGNKSGDKILATISETPSRSHKNVHKDAMSHKTRQKLSPKTLEKSLNSHVGLLTDTLSENPTDSAGKCSSAVAPENSTNKIVDPAGIDYENRTEEPDEDEGFKKPNPEHPATKSHEDPKDEILKDRSSQAAGQSPSNSTNETDENILEKTSEKVPPATSNNIVLNTTNTVHKTSTAEDNYTLNSECKTDKDFTPTNEVDQEDTDAADEKVGKDLKPEAPRSGKDPTPNSSSDVISSSEVISKRCADIVMACLCADELSDRVCPWDVTPDVVNRLQTWWDFLMSNCPGDKEVNDDQYYLSAISRFFNPAMTSKLLMPGISEPVLLPMTFEKVVFVTGELFERPVIYPDMMDLLQEPRMLLCGPPGTGKTTMLMLAGRKWMSDGHDVYILNTSENCVASRLKLVLESPPTGRPAADKTRGKVVVCSENVSDGKNMRQAFKYIMKNAPDKTPIHILADGLECSNEKVKECLETVLRHDSSLHMWITSSRGKCYPTGWRRKLLNRPLTCPPAIMREASSLMAGHLSDDVTPYTPSDYPTPTDGPPVKYVYHQGEGHTTGQPCDCEQCAVDVQQFLNASLCISEADTTSPSDLRPLHAKDLLLLFESKVDSNETVMTKRIIDSHIPVLTVDVSTLPEITEGDTNAALAGEATLLLGLKRKVVVYVEDKGDNSNPAIWWTRLRGITSCSSQLIWVLSSGTTSGNKTLSKVRPDPRIQVCGSLTA